MNLLSKRGHITSLAQAMNLKAKELQNAGHEVLKLHIGSPSTGAPQQALDYLNKVSKKDILGYSSALGIDPLRERISEHYRQNYNLNISPSRIIVTVGASGALILSLLSRFDKDQKVALPYPVYGAYKNIIKLMGLEFIGLPTSIENRFLPTVEDIKNLKEKPDGIILISPGNPSGSVLKPEELKALIDYCKKNHIKVISDEIYHGIVYKDDKKLPSALQYREDAIVINSFSKYYSMPGWRIGWMVAPEEIVNNVGAIMRNILIAPPTPAQYVALKTMDCTDELDSHVQRYKKNRDFLVKELPLAGFDKFIIPEGAFYLYSHIEHLHYDSIKFSHEMLEQTFITFPGTDFDISTVIDICAYHLQVQLKI